MANNVDLKNEADSTNLDMSKHPDNNLDLNLLIMQINFLKEQLDVAIYKIKLIKEAEKTK